MKIVDDITARSSGKKEFLYLLFLGLIAAVPPLATDMYLAAMPTIARQWSVSESQVGHSLVLWFLSFSIFLLVCGPIADKIGRRPVLLGGLVLFTISTVLCGFSSNLDQLIFFRILQGIGASGPSSMCMAICRDKYEGQKRKDMLAYIAIVLCMAPMIAPTIGAFILKYMGWRWIFFAQGILAIVTLLVSTLYKETLAQPLQVGWLRAYGRYLVLFKNKRYMLANSVIGMTPGAFYGYLALSSIAYISIFGQTEFTFAIMFALNALVSIAGAFSCTRLNRKFSDNALITVCLIGCVIAGLGLTIWGSSHFLAFAFFIALMTYFTGMSRPLSNHLILEQVKTDIGSASSFIVFYQMFFGQLCMAYTTLEWSDLIFSYAILALCIPLLIISLWLLLVSSLNKK